MGVNLGTIKLLTPMKIVIILSYREHHNFIYIKFIFMLLLTTCPFVSCMYTMMFFF